MYKSTHRVLMKTILSRSLCFLKLNTAISLVPHVLQKLPITHQEMEFISLPLEFVQASVTASVNRL